LERQARYGGGTIITIDLVLPNQLIRVQQLNFTEALKAEDDSHRFMSYNGAVSIERRKSV